MLGLSVLPDHTVRCHTDKTIEETAMKWLKSISGSGTYSAGISGITSNYEASQRHLLTVHAKGEMLENRQASRAARATGCSTKRKLPLTKGKALVKKTKSVEWFCLVCDENYADSRSHEQWIQCQMCLR